MAFNDQDLFNKMMQASSKQESKEGLFNAINDMPDSLPEPSQAPNAANLSPWAQALEKYVNPYLRPINESIEQNVVQPLMQSPPGAALLGGMQGVHNVGASAVNTFLPEEYQAQPLDTSGLTNPNYAALHGAGDIGGSILGEALMYQLMGGLGKGAQGLKRVGVEALKGAGTGYLGGQFMPGGRETSAALGAAAPFITQSFSPVLSRMIGEDAQKLSQQFGKEYEGFKQQYGSIPTTPTYNKPVQELLHGNRLSNDSAVPFVEYLSNPNIENAHQALSALKAEQRGMLTASNPKPSSLPREDKATYGFISDAIDSISNQMEAGFKASGVPEAQDVYKALSERYKTEYSPYKFSELEAFLTKGLEGKRKGSASGVTKGIHGMKDYPADIHDFFMEKYPELYLNKHIGKIGLGGALLGGSQTDFGQQLLSALLQMQGNE